MVPLRRLICARRRCCSLSLVRVVQLVVVVVVLLYLYVAWLRGNGGKQARYVPLISEVQDEIRSLNIDDFQFQG